mmetsp:Transcript_41271/g.124567  ORF Transcript_41271/g.124567 Transcript_41271/m.124567 type:complete len:185 (-) Transcript_41271:70-624(-)
MLGLSWLRRCVFRSRPQAKVLITGLDSAGKTTFMYQLKLGHATVTTPTIGFNAETFAWKEIDVTFWDVSGRGGNRALVRHFTVDADAHVFMVDSADADRIEDARDLLLSLINDPAMRDLPLLVIANKQDLSGSLSPDEVVDQLGLREFGHVCWRVQAACASSGSGLTEGAQWLHDQVAHGLAGK